MKLEVSVTNKNGLHARPSIALVQKAKEFEAKIKIHVNGTVVNATDVLQVLSLGATCGTKLTLEAEGKDAEQALNELEALFKNNFNVVY